MTIDDIRNLIGRSQIENAMKATMDLAKARGNNEIHNTIFLLSGRFQKNEKDRRIGIIDNGEYTRNRNQITMSILDSLNELDNPAPTIGTPDGGSPSPTLSSTPDGDLPTAAPSKTSANAGVTTILFLASNPSQTGHLQLEKEHSRISKKIQESDRQQHFRILPKDAVTLSEFQESLVKEKPSILHFSGHGKGDQETVQMVAGARDLIDESLPEDDTGIILYDESKRNPFLVKTNVIRRMFKSMVKRLDVPLQIVVFNSCHSGNQAQAIAEVVPYVVGTSWSVNDAAAIAFATGFYFGIAQGMDVEDACDMGINQAMAHGEPEERFMLYKNGEKVEW